MEIPTTIKVHILLRKNGPPGSVYSRDLEDIATLCWPAVELSERVA